MASDLNVALVARDNIFSGDTRIYCKNLTHGYLTFENNVFISDCYEMLLQEFASGGNLIFNNNQVAILFSNNGSYQGRLFVHYSGGLPANAHFDMFEVTGNIVRGTSESIWLGMPSQGDCGTYNVSGNTFYSLPWQTSLF
ncbi:MAG: hypothetical protein IJU62_09685 [Muribaculaceae bacterium]|nr:hypothetical protein [Muribaculaceae bacterium]